MHKTRNIEFIFLAILSGIIITLVAWITGIFVSMHHFTKEHPDNRTGSEWASLAILLLMVVISYSLIFLVWQFRLWQTFVKREKRKALQLVLVFLFGIFPVLTGLIYLFFVKVF